jgi:hypothetical protein
MGKSSKEHYFPTLCYCSSAQSTKGIQHQTLAANQVIVFIVHHRADVLREKKKHQSYLVAQ